MLEEDKKTPKRVAVYIRVSTEDQLDGYGPDTQREAVLGLIKARENTIEPLEFAGEEHIYFDEGISGTIPMEERPAFSRLKEAIELAPDSNKPFDTVAVYRIDRFARKLKVLLDVIGFFEDNEIQFLSVTENIDTSNPFGKAIVSIIGVIAELEIETLKQRTSGGRIQAIKNGIFVGNAPPLGYIKGPDKRLRILKKEAEHVKTIFDLFVNQKYSISKIAKYLKEHKALSPIASSITNKKRKGTIRKDNSYFHWGQESVRRVLKEDLYIGRYYYGKTKAGKLLPKEKWKLSPYTVPIIIDLITFEKAQQILGSLKHQQRNTGRRATPYILTGLLRCDNCYDRKTQRNTRQHWVGSPKKVKSSGRYIYYYSCGRKNISKYEKTCNLLPFPAEAIEKYIIDFCLNLIKSPIAVLNHQKELESSRVEMKQLQKKIESINELIIAIPKKRNNILEQHANSYIDGQELDKQIKDLENSEKRYRNEMNELQRKVSENALSDKYLQTLTLFNEKYQKVLESAKKNPKEATKIINMLIDEIVVYSRPVTDKDKIAGRKKEDQQIANRLHIKLKLPQDILNKIGKQKVYIDGSSSQEHIAGAR